MKVVYHNFVKMLLPVLFLVLFCPGISAGKVLIGVIMTANISYYDTMHQAFVANLQKTLPPGEEVQFILQRPFPDPIAWSNAARKLIAVEVDLIVSYGAPATHSVLFEKSKIPVVYAGVYEPEAAEIKSQYVTGCGYRVPLSSLLRYFKRIKDVNKLLAVYSSTEEDSVRQMNELASLAKEQKIELTWVDIRSQGDVKKLKKVGRGDAVYITGSSLAHTWMEDILFLLDEKKVPAVDIFPDPIEMGLLITLFHPPELQGEAAAKMALKIIGGEKAENITPQLLRETELVLNLVKARALDITLPLQLMVEATRVIK